MCVVMFVPSHLSRLAAHLMLSRAECQGLCETHPACYEREEKKLLYVALAAEIPLL